MHQGQPRLQSAGCARRDQRDRACRLYRAGSSAGEGLLRSLAGNADGPLQAPYHQRGPLMPDLLLEVFSEEIPARMQAGAARDLERLAVGALSDRGLLFEGIKAFAGPRRLTLAVNGLPAKQADVKEERKGPRVGAPEKAIEGFLRGAGVTLDQCQKQDDGKGEFYVAVIDRKGRETAAVLAEILPEVIAKLPWPKSMRWKPGVTTRWMRPLHSILCTFDGETVPFSFAGVSSGRHTRGHRFLAPETIEVRRFEDYAAALKKAFVVLEADERAAIIFE